MAVHRLATFTVPDHDLVAVNRIIGGLLDTSASGGPNRITKITVKIDPSMITVSAVYRVDAGAEVAGNVPALNGCN
jgi:hypothetical protein